MEKSPVNCTFAIQLLGMSTGGETVMSLQHMYTDLVK